MWLYCKDLLLKQKFSCWHSDGSMCRVNQMINTLTVLCCQNLVTAPVRTNANIFAGHHDSTLLYKVFHVAKTFVYCWSSGSQPGKKKLSVFLTVSVQTCIELLGWFSHVGSSVMMSPISWEFLCVYQAAECLMLNNVERIHAGWGQDTHCRTSVSSLMACTATSYSLSRVIDTMRSCQ